MQIKLNKGEHKALLNTNEELVSLVTWNGISKEKNLTGVLTEDTGSAKNSMILLRRLSRMLQSNGYKLSDK